MPVYIPCLAVDSDNTSGSGIQLVTPQSIASGAVSLAGSAIQVGVGDSFFYLNPYTAILSFAINWQFWANLFGLGETRIDREKEQIQDILTAIFTYLHSSYDVPVTDGHALQFPSDGVQHQFDLHPEIAALVPEFMADAPVVTKNVFPHGDPTEGQQERVVNQFLANAAYNGWPVDATRAIWQGIVDAAQPGCSQQADRWLKNPQIVRSAAIGAALLQYIPLSVLNDMAAGHHIGDPLLENLIHLWADNPDLVSSITPITGLPWQSIYTEGRWALPPYGGPFGSVVPLLQRDHILPIVASVQVPRVVYPNFGQAPTPQPLPPPPPVSQPQPPYPVPQPQPQPQPAPQPPPTPQPQPQPEPPPQVLEIAPPQPPDVAPDQFEFSAGQIDFACWISRLLFGNAPLTNEEHRWLSIEGNVRVLNSVINNPQCQAPLTRRQPYDPTTPIDPGCFPVLQPHVTGGDQGTGPLQPLPPPGWQGQQPGPGQECPPDCLAAIDELRQRQEHCCDETEFNAIPRIVSLEEFRDWIYSVFHVPTPPVVLHDPTGTVPGEDEPIPTQDPPPPDQTIELPPISNCDSPFVTSLLACLTPQLFPPDGINPALCAAILTCIEANCVQVKERLRRCPDPVETDPCNEGIQKWGKWAECWLRTNTPFPQTRQGYWERILKSGQFPSRINSILAGQGDTLSTQIQQHAVYRVQRALAGDFSLIGRPAFYYEPGLGYVFEKIEPPNVLEIP